ncbi:hypothetical protein Lal_00008699, partial [Lupinus albus]
GAAGAGDRNKKPGAGKGGWQDDASKRRGIKTRGDSSGGVDRGWRGGPKGRGRHQDNVDQGLRSHQGDDEDGPDGHDQPGAGPGNGDDRRRGTGPPAVAAKLDDPEALLVEGETVPTRATAASAGRHGDGSRRPRQDLAARPHPPREGCRRRSGRHYAAHRRISRRYAAGVITFLDTPGHERSRQCVHAARRRPTSWCWWWRRRRRDAADEGSHRPREGGWRADRRRDQQDRQAGSEPRSRQAGTGRGRRRAGRIRRRFAVRAGVGEDGRGHRRSARERAAAGRSAGTEGTGRSAGQGYRDRSEARQGQGPGRDDPRAVRYAEPRRHRAGGYGYGRVRAMLDENGKPTKEAGPSIPVEIQGLSEVPGAGEEVIVLPDERKARKSACSAKSEPAAHHQGGRAGLAGSARAVAAQAVDRRSARADRAQRGGRHQRKRRQPRDGIEGVIIGFNTRADAQARKLAEANGIDIRYYNIIYDAVDEVKAAMSGMLAPEKREVITGMVEVRQVFKVPKVGTVAGCMVTDGIVKRSSSVRVLRNNVVIFTGELESLKRFKDDVKEVKQGFECGMSVKNFNDVIEGDQFEVFEVTEVARTLKRTSPIATCRSPTRFSAICPNSSCASQRPAHRHRDHPERELTPDTRTRRSTSRRSPAIRKDAGSAEPRVGSLHNLLFKRLHIHTVPTLHFHYDQTIEKAVEMSRLIKEANSTRAKDDDEADAPTKDD